MWQKYSEDSRIEFACFSVCVGLLVITLSSLKLHENYACMLCTSVSCWSRLFLLHLRRRSLCIICETDDRRIPRLTWNFSDCSVALRFVFPTQQQRLNCVNVFISTGMRSTASVDALMPVDCSELHQQPVGAVLRPTFGQKLCYKLLQHLHSCRLLTKILSSLLSGVKVAAFAWYNVKIRVIFGVRFERRKVDKTASLHENWNIETFEYICQIPSKSIIISSYTVSKLGRFLRHSVDSIV